ncbi:antibiotic biosynthesis monooxygenase family protein [Pseudoalteromonas luteoviolacea]|uniref:ABM domain-containing protein n=1 Tax=Pseudoalteromonas luteoviolacea S4054 TaxID=1129367 RepID=A0A0F6AGL3_9GAMM|nr:hypothetical protein [Pseudoalteromonas luteoviolacea]AOT11190.1 hypothetical protein S4054249_25525 [Pseudoalteromonas luteoviolacea]AOT15646.1 hypothetical protein S40542_22985 [Pseudoalteromonas luteoviolacea]AOT21011.1 hypothetical protein S4054_25445 [Pseudoalteromonas luteoviolacea]KKE84539.1 hypothetical protein N479_08215 [Pseudoalteromonas luteoviolacea S4054]KZN71316.1 hypothetical protein N481_19205 [Pseudoalteromonas luteoviolacea S4047-1]
MNQNVIKIVSFKLNKGISVEQLMEKSTASGEFVATQPGFIYRSLAQQSNSDTFVDISYWQTMEDCQHMQLAFEDADVCQAYCALVDSESVGISHHSVLSQSDCTA